MPYLTCIGGHGHAGENHGGAGARGYWVFRRGTSVVRRYGPVMVDRARHVRIRWVRYKEMVTKTRSVAEAITLKNELIREKLEPGEGYKLMRSGTKIW